MQRSHMSPVMKTLLASAKKKSTHEIVYSLRVEKVAEKILGARKHTSAVPSAIYLKCLKNHSNKPMSGAGSPSCRPGSVQLNL